MRDDPYNFNAQVKQGKKGEALLDEYYSEWCEITRANGDQERKGIDRFYVTYASGRHWSIQYKTDFMSQRTGNMFVETVSVDTTDTPGWAYTCTAKALIWLRYYEGEMLVIQPEALRHYLPEWKQKYRIVPVQNEDYRTIGVLVPLGVIRHISRWTGMLPEDMRP